MAIDQQPVHDTVVEDAPSDEVVECLDDPDAPEPLEEAVVDEEDVIDEIVEPDELDDEDAKTVDDDNPEEVLEAVDETVVDDDFEDVDEPTPEQQPDDEKVVDAFDDFGKTEGGLSDDSLGVLKAHPEWCCLTSLLTTKMATSKNPNPWKMLATTTWMS